VEFKARTVQFESQQEEFKKSQQQFRQLKDDNVRFTKDNQILQVRFDNSSSEYTELLTSYDKLRNDCKHHVFELKEKQDEIIQLRKERDNERKKNDQAEKRVRQVEDRIGAIEHEREGLRSMIPSFEQEIDQFKKTQDENQSQINSLTRERETLHTKCRKLAVDNQKQTDQMKGFEQSKRTLEHDINKYREEVSEQQRLILKTENERDR
jgi:chromosome segregation ATPase